MAWVVISRWMELPNDTQQATKQHSLNRYSRWSRDYRIRKELTMCGVFIPTDIHKRFSTIASKRKESKRAVLEACIRNYITKYETNTSEA
jgi:hypothetical protein